MTKKLLLCLIFFSVSPIVLFFSVFLLKFTDNGKVLGETVSLSPSSSRILSSLQEDNGIVAPVIIADNSVPIMIEKYLRRYQSPLLPYKENIIRAAEKYNVKPQLIVAIAQQESNLGKKSPENCYNAWGWGIHARGTTCFSNWGEAIEKVTKGISEKYCDKGYCNDPCVMMKKYTPHSNGSWCYGVNQFLSELETGNF